MLPSLRPSTAPAPWSDRQNRAATRTNNVKDVRVGVESLRLRQLLQAGKLAGPVLPLGTRSFASLARVSVAKASASRGSLVPRIGAAGVVGLVAAFAVPSDAMDPIAALAQPRSSALMDKKPVHTVHHRMTSKFLDNASVERPSDQKLFMKQEDFVRSRSHVPRGKPLLKPLKEPRILSLYQRPDSEQYGLMSFGDYIVIDSLLTRPRQEFEVAFKMFDDDDDGLITYQQFKQVMVATRRARSIRFDFECEIVRHFFGEKFDGRLSLTKFLKFLDDLELEVFRQDYYQMERDGGISAYDFAVMMTERASQDELPTYVMNNLTTVVAKLGDDIKLSIDDLRAFNRILANIESFERSLQIAAIPTGAVTKVGFRRAANALLGIDVSAPMLAVLFHVFDHGGRGFLDVETFMSVVQYRRDVQLNVAARDGVPQQPQGLGFLGTFMHGIKNFSIGGIAGAIGATVVYPIDLVKTRMQNQRAGQQLYKNAWDCFRQVIKNEGPVGLYRGLGPQLVGVAPEKALKLVVNDMLRGLFEDRKKGEIYFPLEVLAGMGAGASQVIVTNPLEILKIRLQVQGEIARLEGVAPKGAFTIMRELGFTGMYRGASACFLRDIPFSGLYFPCYATMKTMMKDEQGHVGPMALLLAGSGAGVIAASLSTPADVIKTRLQVEARAGQESYNGIVDCARKILKSEGPSAFFKGVLPRVFRSSPQFGVTLLSYEYLQEKLSDQSQAVPVYGGAPTNAPVTQFDIERASSEKSP